MPRADMTPVVRPARAEDIPAIAALRATRRGPLAAAEEWAARTVSRMGAGSGGHVAIHVACMIRGGGHPGGGGEGSDRGDGGDRDREPDRESDRDRSDDREHAVVGYGVADLFQPPADAPPHVAPAGIYLVGVIVDPAARRIGVGRALVASRLEWASARADAAWYFADDDNTASIRLHEPFGFRPVTRRFWFPGMMNPDAAMTLYRADLAR